MSFASVFALVATSANAKCKARLGDFDEPEEKGYEI